VQSQGPTTSDSHPLNPFIFNLLARRDTTSDNAQRHSDVPQPCPEGSDGAQLHTRGRMAIKKLTDADVRNAKPKGTERVELWDSQTPGLCLRVSQSRKTWLVRYRAGGKQRRHVFGEYPDLDLADARVQGAQILRGVRKDGADPARDRQRKKAEAQAQPIKTLRDMAEAYFEACQNGHWRPRGKSQSARTLKDLRESLDRYVLPEMGDLPLADVTRPVVKRFLRDLSAKGIAAQANKAISAIRRIYNWAIVEHEGQVVAVNVATALPREPEAPRTRVLTDDELKLLWAALRDPANIRAEPAPGEEQGARVYLSRQMAILLQLAVLLLQRRTELAGMTASELNLDLDSPVWLIPAARMKARKAHLVPLPPRAAELLREALKLAKAAQKPLAEGEKAPADFPVFPSTRDPLRSILPGSVTHAMKPVTDALGIAEVSPHDIRRTGSTALTSERLGVSPFIRSQVLSHTTDTGGGAAVSGRHYDANTYVTEKRAALQAWEDLVLEIVGERPRPTNVRKLASRRAATAAA